LTLFLFCATFSSSSGENINLFVGAYGDTIYQCVLNTEDGKLAKKEGFTVGPNPSYLEWLGDRLYVVNEEENYPVQGAGGSWEWPMPHQCPA